MLFPLFSTIASPAVHFGATSATIKCLLANTLGLHDCHIDAEIVNGVIILTGTSTSEAAAHHAAAVATDFTSKQVVCDVQVMTPSRSS